MRADVAIIGGTGVGPSLAAMGGRPVAVPTRLGLVRGRLLDHQGLTVLLLQRHSGGHRVPPHRVAYGAMALAMQLLGVRGCLASAAVGSLREDWPVRTIAVITDTLDLTCRNLTLHDSSVNHTPVGQAMALSSALIGALGDTPHQPSAVYVGMNGPRYETPVEIRALRALGGDVVGMTASTEAFACAEAGVRYGCISVVTNLGEGLVATATPDHPGVSRVMESMGDTLIPVLLGAAERVARG